MHTNAKMCSARKCMHEGVCPPRRGCHRNTDSRGARCARDRRRKGVGRGTGEEGKTQRASETKCVGKEKEEEELNEDQTERKVDLNVKERRSDGEAKGDGRAGGGGKVRMRSGFRNSDRALRQALLFSALSFLPAVRGIRLRSLRSVNILPPCSSLLFLHLFSLG